MDSYTTVKQYATFEYEDRKSVFIGDVMPVSCEEDALRFIEQIKKRYPDAKHHVYAYVLRENSISRFTDDREPQGTAGMPVLDSLRKNGITDTVVVVTRYFGGTLLGTGGLVRAYSAAALGAIKAAGIAVFDIYTTLKLTLSYSDYQKALPLFEQLSFRTEEVKYADNIVISGSVLKSSYSGFEKEIIQLTSGRSKPEIIEEKFDC